MGVQSAFGMLKKTVNDWLEDNSMVLAAAVAFYTMFSLAPLLVIAIWVAGFFFGQGQAQEQLVSQMEQMMGEQGAQAIKTALDNAQQSGSGTIATILSLIMLVIGATGVFAQLQQAMNQIWEVKEKPGQGVMSYLRKRLVSFGIVLIIGLLLLALLLAAAALSTVQGYMKGVLPGEEYLWQILNFVVTLAVVTVLFAAIYKLLPDVKIAWSDVWIGAAVTAVLFAIGKFLIGLYLGHSTMGSTYGAAGSLAILLVWVYYSTLIFFFGAEFTQVYARRYGTQIEPDSHAVRVERSEREVPKDEEGSKPQQT